MIDVKVAVRRARNYLMEMVAEGLIDLAPEAAVSLEEVELTQDEKYWLVTLGYDTKRELEYSTLLDPDMSAIIR